MSEEEVRAIVKLVMVDDIDTDQIFHQSLLTIHDPEEIKPHIFGNLDGYENFGKEDNTGKIILVGFLAHGIKAIIGESFGPIYYSNAVNSGLLLVEVPDISKFDVKENDKLEININQSIIVNLSNNSSIKCAKIPQPVLDIMKAGGLLKLGEKM